MQPVFPVSGSVLLPRTVLLLLFIIFIYIEKGRNKWKKKTICRVIEAVLFSSSSSLIAIISKHPLRLRTAPAQSVWSYRFRFHLWDYFFCQPSLVGKFKTIDLCVEILILIAWLIVRFTHMYMVWYGFWNSESNRISFISLCKWIFIHSLKTCLSEMVLFVAL